MMAKITSPELASDVPGAELLISRHEEYQQEMGSRNEAFADFIDTGHKLIEQVIKFTIRNCILYSAKMLIIFAFAPRTMG
jgi:hypothetical protein